MSKKLSSITNEPMTFTGVRSIFLRAVRKIATEYVTVYSPELFNDISQKEHIEALTNSVDFQNAVGEHLTKLYGSF